MKKLLAFTFFSLCFTSFAAPKIHFSTVEVPLVELARDAHRIFVGKLKSNRVVEDRVRGEGLKKLVSTFEAEQVLRGKEKVGGEVHVSRYFEGAIPVKEGEEVLWFLSKESKLGLTAPLGIHSGDFRIRLDEKKNRMVMNLKLNAGLWKKGETFWKATGCTEARFRKIAKERRIAATEIDALVPYGNLTDTENKPLPLNFVLVAFHALK